MDGDKLSLMIKIIAMFVMFLIIAIFGSIPFRMKSFKSSPRVLSYAKAFSGGLFLAVGLIHLLPEANESFSDYFKEQDGDEEKEHFPFAFLTLVLSFCLVLFIEKIATDHHHGHSEEDERRIRKTILNTINRDYSDQFGDSEHKHDHDHDHNHKINVMNAQIDASAKLLENPEEITHLDEKKIDEDEEEQFKNIVRATNKIAKGMSFVQNVKKSVALNPKNSHLLKEINSWAPFILQIAIGIHATFEGLAIGIETKPSLVIGISIAVMCHKWAEGLTLGLAFADAKVDIKTSQIMILIQAIMNPIGIGIGWGLSGQSPLVTGIFESISAGTFVYIATAEVIVEEFSISRYKKSKFLLLLIAVGFVCSLWFIEQATGG